MRICLTCHHHTSRTRCGLFTIGVNQVQTTQHPAADAITAACKKTLTSAAFAKFMGAAVQQALAETQAQGPTLAVLRGPAEVEFDDYIGGMSITSAARDVRITLYRDRDNHNMTPKGLWWGGESRTDSNGIRWNRSLPNMVQDDFGTLVEVPA